MPGKRALVFSREFKEAAVLRILAGERVQALAAELHPSAAFRAYRPCRARQPLRLRLRGPPLPHIRRRTSTDLGRLPDAQGVRGVGAAVGRRRAAGPAACDAAGPPSPDPVLREARHGPVARDFVTPRRRGA